MLGIHNLPEPLQTLVIFIITGVVITSISIVFYRFARKKWHFTIAKFFIDMMFTLTIIAVPINLIMKLFQDSSYEMWVVGGYFLLLLVFIKKIIAIEDSIRDRLKQINRADSKF